MLVYMNTTLTSIQLTVTLTLSDSYISTILTLHRSLAGFSTVRLPQIHLTMSSYGILSDLVSLETLASSSTRPQQHITDLDLASLLPLPSTDDVAELQEVISHDAWGVANASPKEIHNSYQGTVEYLHIDRRGTLILAHRPRTSRAEALFTLEHYYYLRKHLTSNLDLIAEHGEAGLSIPLSFRIRRSSVVTPLELAQYSFAIHHTGINETLIDAEKLGTLASVYQATRTIALFGTTSRMRFRRRKWIRVRVTLPGRYRGRRRCTRGCWVMLE
jgi:hypothetical protein